MKQQKPFIKITVETSSVKGMSIVKDSAEDLSEVVRVFEDALKACGYCFTGPLDLMED